MKTSIAPLAITALILVACAGEPRTSSAPSGTPVTSTTTGTPLPTASASPLPTPLPTRTSTPSPTASPAIACIPGPDETIVTVSAKANIFGAGHSDAPEPGGGGGGDLPPVVELPSAATGVVVFPCVTGRISCCFGTSYSDASGTTDYMTSINSFDGLSGIVHGERSVFLVGVFLGDAEPANPAPERLNFTQTCPDVCVVEFFEPEIGQTFFIGVGGEMPEYVAPEGATRLFLGFADAAYTQGDPGWYRNNSGLLEVVVRIP